MWVVPHELLQFCRDKSCEYSHENNEDNFFLILLIFYQNDTVGENYHLPYENNKIPNVIQSEKKQFNNCV